MPNLTIYLDSKLYERVKKQPSKIIQKALKAYFNNQQIN